MATLDLDKKLATYEERKELVEKELKRIGAENLSVRQLDKISSYLIEGTNPEARGEIITANRLVTVNKRETSREGLIDKLEGGESAFYQLIKQDRSTILTPKVEITEEDIAEVPGLAQLREEIAKLEKLLKTSDKLDTKSRGKVKQTIIEMRRDQYVLKNAYRQPIFGKGNPTVMDTDATYDLSLQDASQVLALLVNYPQLKEEFLDNNMSDMKWILEDLDRLIKKALKDKESLMFILQGKMIGASNNEIRALLKEIFNLDHTQEYISSLYRNKIPALIVEAARDEWINYMYTDKLKGNYKRCSRCKKIKLANNRNFSINRTSSSQFYSICKECRNKK